VFGRQIFYRTLKMEAAGCSKMLVPFYQATRHLIQECHDGPVYINCHNELESISSKEIGLRSNVTKIMTTR